jgi:hypothetical protein
MNSSIIVIVLCLLSGIGFFVFKKNVSSGKQKNDMNTAQEFINVMDIQDQFLYTLDGYVMTYISITPISIELLSEKEKEHLELSITAEFRNLNKPFKFIAVSRPIDISALLEEYKMIISKSDDQVQKVLLRKEIYVMSDYALSGEVLQRKFYIMLWEKYKEGIEEEILKGTKDFVKRFEMNNIKCSILEKAEIITVLNLINNPHYESLEEEVII